MLRTHTTVHSLPTRSTGPCSVLGTERSLNGALMVVADSLSQGPPKSHHWDFSKTPGPCSAKSLLEFEEDNLF